MFLRKLTINNKLNNECVTKGGWGDTSEQRFKKTNDLQYYSHSDTDTKIERFSVAIATATSGVVSILFTKSFRKCIFNQK